MNDLGRFLTDFLNVIFIVFQGYLLVSNKVKLPRKKYISLATCFTLYQVEN